MLVKNELAGHSVACLATADQWPRRAYERSDWRRRACNRIAESRMENVAIFHVIWTTIP
jgi:hypothetical protein